MLKSMRRTWVKIYVDQWLRGTLRDELEPDERSIWADFIALAGDSPFEGKIAITESIGYSDEQLAEMLKCPVELIQRAKAKFLKYDKITQNNYRVIDLQNWQKFQSEYQRQKKYREFDPDGPKSDNEKLQNKVTDRERGRERGRERERKEIRIGKKDIDSVLEKWNKFADKYSLPRVLSITGTRRNHFQARFREKGFNFDELLTIITKSPFLLGRNKKGFFVFFDWIILPTNYQKIIEGNYIDRRLSGIKSWLDAFDDDEDKG